MISDLASPWCAALEASDPVRACAVFRRRHAALLDALRRARAPLADSLPLPTDVERLRPVARRAADPASQQQLRDLLVLAADLGADRCAGVVLIAGGGSGGAAEPIPWPDRLAVLFLDRIDDETRLVAALAGAVVAITRWSAPGSRTAIVREGDGGWDHWAAASTVPLREWVYTEGLGTHLCHALRPDLAPHQLLGVTQVAFGRLREREKAMRALLAADLDQRGIGLILRWLTPDAPAGPRTVGDVVLPPMAGRYLAWRMLRERIARAGLRAAICMEA